MQNKNEKVIFEEKTMDLDLINDTTTTSTTTTI